MRAPVSSGGSSTSSRALARRGTRRGRTTRGSTRGTFPRGRPCPPTTGAGSSTSPPTRPRSTTSAASAPATTSSRPASSPSTRQPASASGTTRSSTTTSGTTISPTCRSSSDLTVDGDPVPAVIQTNQDRAHLRLQPRDGGPDLADRRGGRPTDRGARQLDGGDPARPHLAGADGADGDAAGGT